MAFWKKKPQRLYIATGKRWYTRKRRNKVPKRRRTKSGLKELRTFFGKLVKNSIHYVIIGIAVVVLILFLLFSSYFAILGIQVDRETLTINSAAIENELNGFIGKNILFLPRSRMIQIIKESFPEFEKVTLNKVLPNQIRIQLQSYPIIANMRAYYVLPKAEITVQEFSALNKAIAELEGSGTDSFDSEVSEDEIFNPLDNPLIAEAAFDLGGERSSDELIVEEKPIEQKSLLNRIGQAIFDQEEDLELVTIAVRGLTQPVEDRGVVIPIERMDYLLEAKDYFANTMGLEVRGIEFLPIAREIHLKTDKITVWINMEREYKKQIDKLAAIYEEAELDKEDLNYIDLRAREKVIYCPQKARCAR